MSLATPGDARGKGPTMPTYDYVCEKCDHAFEEFQSITAKPLRKCPSCGKQGLKRLIGTGAGVIFKGSGFYETDYRSSTYQKAAKADADAGQSGSSDSGEKKGDAAKKPADSGSAAKDTSGSASAPGAAKKGGTAKSGGEAKSSS